VLQNYKPQLSEEKFKVKVKFVAGPRRAHDTKTEWLTGCPSQYAFEFKKKGSQ
jgi:hypothetical protein